MDPDPMQYVEEQNDDEKKKEVTDARSTRKLNTLVAISVALLATFMGICKIKDDNIVQAMQQAQADKLDHWNFYQARNIRQEVAKATVTQLQLARMCRAGAETAAYDEPIARYEKIAAEQAGKKEELKKQAEQDQKTY